MPSMPRLRPRRWPSYYHYHSLRCCALIALALIFVLTHRGTFFEHVEAEEISTRTSFGIIFLFSQTKRRRRPGIFSSNVDTFRQRRRGAFIDHAFSSIFTVRRGICRKDCVPMFRLQNSHVFVRKKEATMMKKLTHGARRCFVSSSSFNLFFPFSFSRQGGGGGGVGRGW